MERIKLTTEALIEAIQESEVYQNFEHMKKVVNKDPALKAQITDFRRRNYVLQNQMEGIDLYQEIEQFEEEYHEVRKNPIIRDFLQYELEICRMMQRINLRLIQAVDLDIQDLQDIIK
jgi:cell fate (sporulation/competence/biofilm development) regulator YlbF (YheA/YmcA/DUF963 family)